MDEQMDALIMKLPFSKDIRNALLSSTGEMAGYLNLVRAYETGDWEAVSQSADIIGMDKNRIPMLYWDAVVWTDTLTASG